MPSPAAAKLGWLRSTTMLPPIESPPCETGVMPGYTTMRATSDGAT